MAQPSSSSTPNTSSGSEKPEPAMLSPLTTDRYLGPIAPIFSNERRELSRAEIGSYYNMKAALERSGVQTESEWDGSTIDYAQYYNHRLFHHENCMCPHDLGPAFNGPGKWNRGAYNCYDPKDYPTAATGTPTQSYQTNGNAGESSAMAAQSFLGRERQQWDRIQAYWNHEYIKSPFAPSTLEEYLTFKGETVKAKQLALLKKIDDDFNQHTDPNNQPVRVQMSPRLLQIHQNDGLTLVNARISIWHQNPTLFIPIDWPVLWEYEYYQGKQLPLPRVQLVDEAFEHLVTRWRNFPDHGPGVPRQFRKIAQRALRPAYDNMTAPEFEDMTQERDREVAELNMDDLNGFTRELLQNIDG